MSVIQNVQSPMTAATHALNNGSPTQQPPSIQQPPVVYYDPTRLEYDIKTSLQGKFFSRQELIEKVREFGSQRGFNICIPRGDIVLQDGTLQVTLYCHKYGIKRKRNNKDTPKKNLTPK